MTAPDLTVTLYGPSPVGHLDGTEPCESCATPVLRLNLADEVADMLHGGPDNPLARLAKAHHDGQAWQESHLWATGDGRAALTLRAHTVDRCSRARAGDPEPLPGLDEDDDDDFDWGPE